MHRVHRRSLRRRGGDAGVRRLQRRLCRGLSSGDVHGVPFGVVRGQGRSRVDERGILIVFFDRASSLGLVRLRARKGSAALAGVFEEAQKENEAEKSLGNSTFANITDEEIDNLFSD